MATSDSDSTAKPVLIIGAGISGLLLAQHLSARGVPFRIFDRDVDFTTRGLGWGLTLHWSLPALRELLPERLVSRIPSTYVDRRAVEAGEATTFPLHDLATGELVAATPRATEATRIRVTREKLRRLLADGVAVEWGRPFSTLKETGPSEVTAVFEDGSEVVGSLVVACDGGHSRVRRALFPDSHQNYRIPVRVVGFRANYTSEAMAPIRKLDPFFLQATSSKNGVFMYFSVLDAPGNEGHGTDAAPVAHTVDGATATGRYSCQVVISWPYREGFGWGAAKGPLDFPSTPQGTVELIRSLSEPWAEPFKSIAEVVAVNAELKQLDLSDYAPAKDLRTRGRAVLMGDAFHAMAMYRGEGANHAIVDVLDFAQKVTPHLVNGGGKGLRQALDNYEDGVIKRSRPAVLASRRACLDAHDWSRVNPQSPLLSRREMFLQYEEEAQA